MDKDLKEFIEQQRRDYGNKAVEDSGLSWLADVYPERLRHFIEDCRLDYEVGSLPRKTLELVLFAACVALRNTIGIQVHAKGCLSAGATEKEIMDVMFAVAAVASHNISANDLSVIKQVFENNKPRKIA